MVTSRNKVCRLRVGRRFTHRVLISLIAAGNPARCSGVNRFAIPAHVVDAGVGTGSNT